MQKHSYTARLGESEILIETGTLAKQASGSVTVRCGDSVVLVTATSANPREGVDFFPLSVDYEERLYAAGRIPGSFQRREGRPSDDAILTSRLVDRPLRPLFPKGMLNEVQVVLTALSRDPEYKLDILGIILAVLGGVAPNAKLAARARCAGLLGNVLRDLAPVKYQVTDGRYQALLDAVMAMFDRDKSRNVPIETRIEAADALGQAVDPRLDFRRQDCGSSGVRRSSWVTPARPWRMARCTGWTTSAARARSPTTPADRNDWRAPNGSCAWTPQRASCCGSTNTTGPTISRSAAARATASVNRWRSWRCASSSRRWRRVSASRPRRPLRRAPSRRSRCARAAACPRA